MAIGNSNQYQLMVEHSYRFARDEVIIKIVKHTQDGVVPIKLALSELPMVPQNTEMDVEIGNAIPRELAELMLAAFGRYFLSSEGDLVETNARLERELAKANLRLDNLISGIGKLGGK